jgi:WD40 repeat protein
MRQKVAHPEGVSAMRWHPSLPMLCTAGLDGVSRVWDARSGNLVRGFTGHTQGGLDVLFAPISETETALVSSADDGTARVFWLDLARTHASGPSGA